MKVEYIYKKGSREVNEDQFVVAESLFAVFDGATGLDGFTDEQGNTGALLASSAAARVFEENGSSLPELIRAANKSIEIEMHNRGAATSVIENRWMTTAIAVRIQEQSFDWVHIGDGNILVVHESGSHTLLAGDVDHDQELFLKWKKIAEDESKIFWEEMHDELILLRRQANVSYGMLDGRKAALKFLQSGTESLDTIRTIILFTDGLMVPKEDPRKEDDVDLFVRLFNEGGLKKIYEYTRSKEREDPRLIRYLRAKLHDDATAIAITL